MALPIVAIVGRPNVGKSTLVNRIAENNEAIVHEMRGVTRDRSYHEADWNGREFTLIDTGGIEMNKDDVFQESIRSQALVAAEQADVILFLVDSKTGINADDQAVANILRRDLLDEVVQRFPEPTEEEHDELDAINVAIIGRPNAGKSSLTNKLTNNDRSIVSDVAGTTRDAIDTTIEHEGRYYTIIDTAGLRRKSVIDEDVEYYGYVRALRAIDRAEVVLLVIDGTIGLTDQDQRVAGMAAERGCAMVIILNKWDLVEGPEAKAEIRERIKDRLMFVGYAPVIAISALSGKNVHRIWNAIDTAYDNYCSTISTSKLNNWLQEIRDFGHTISKGKKLLKIKYVTQTGTCPPQFTFFCNHPDIIEPSYERYLEKRLRSTFDLEGTPVRLRFKRKD